MPKKVCGFCGRDESQVRLLITGINAFICEDCAKQAWDIVQSTGVLKSGKEQQGGEKDNLAGNGKEKRPCVVPGTRNSLIAFHISKTYRQWEREERTEMITTS